MKEKSCGTIIFRYDPGPFFLLLHYGEGHWDFPKGHVEGNETEEQTARRELMEETGISTATLILGFREVIEYFFTANSNRIKKEVVFFLMKTDEKDIKLSHEHIGFEWLSFDDAMKRLTFGNAKGILEKAHYLISKG